MTSSVEGTTASPGPDAVAADSGFASSVAPAEFCINFAVSNRAVHCRADQTILEAAEAAGFPIPFSCPESPHT
jgi:ferredoxin